MSSFLLRVEGVNLFNFISDTQDLSTIRGGGLLLLNAAVHVGDFLASAGCTADKIIEGASIGLFRIRSDKPAKQVRREVADDLTSWLPEATFVVDVIDTEENSPASRALVEAQNRWRQMQAPTVVYPALGVDQNAGICDIDMVRPAKARGRESASVERRRQYGRDCKQRFYAEEIGRVDTAPAGLRYTQDFDGLCGDSQQWGNLRDKMAVLYLDGNGFGVVKDECEKEQELKDFSRGLRNEHARILRELITNRILPDTEWQRLESVGGETRGQIRLETLLWGGDEIIWVAPAWKGWELLQFFFDQCDVDPHPKWNCAKEPLTYSAGLAFCYRKAPIHTITALAEDLVRVVKDRNKTEGNRYQNRFLYQVLESFDHIGKADEHYQDLVLPARIMKEIASAMPAWRETISRKKLHKAVKEQNKEKAKEIGEDIKREVQAAGTPHAEKAMAGIQRLQAVSEDKVWQHIVELWDYVAPERSEV